MIPRPVSLLLILTLTSIWALTAAESQTLPAGQVIPQVNCIGNPEQNYALYLPATYDPSRKWPIVYCFDPGGRGKIPVERFSPAAEKYGYVVAGSNNSRNGPWNRAPAELKALWDDTHRRLAIDNDQVYTAGFSGGAQVAMAFHLILNQRVAGIMACSNELPQWMKPEQLPRNIFIFATVGSKDFNYQKVKRLLPQLDQQGIRRHLEVFADAHAWPPQDLFQKAMERMEVEAMRTGKKEKNEPWLQQLFEKEFQLAQSLETAGQLLAAHNTYLRMAADFEGIVNTAAISEKIAALETSKDFKAEQKIEAKVAKTEEAMLKRIHGIYIEVLNSLNEPFKLKKLVASLGISDLLEEAEANDTPEAGMASRLLAEIISQAYFNDASSAYEQKNYPRAIFFMEIAAAANPRSPGIPYNMACVYALQGEKSKALKALSRAIENGFSGAGIIENDPDLQSLRQEPEYLKLLENLKKKSQ